MPSWRRRLTAGVPAMAWPGSPWTGQQCRQRARIAASLRAAMSAFPCSAASWTLGSPWGAAHKQPRCGILQSTAPSNDLSHFF